MASKYPYPSTINPTGFVSVKLSGNSNYSQWKMQMVCLIESQELVGFIDGTILPPPETMAVSSDTEEGAAVVVVVVNDEYRMWKRSDRLVKGWILGSLGEQVLATMDAELSTARDVWTMLQSTLGPHSQEEEERKEKKEEEKEKEEEEEEEKEEEEEENEEVTTTVGQLEEVSNAYLSTIDPSNICPIKLTATGTNYTAWLNQIISLVVSQNLVGFIFNPPPPEFVTNPNQDATGPSQVLNEDYTLWEKMDLVLKVWILGSLSEDLLDTVKDMRTAHDIMCKLEETFVSDNEFDAPITMEEEQNEEEKEKEKEGKEEVTTLTTTTGGQQAILYPYPSDINPADILSIKLNANWTNFNSWVKQLVSLVVSQALTGFITNPPPPSEVVNQNGQDISTQEEVLNEDYKLWRRTDLLLKGWILDSLSEDLLDLVKDERTSRDVYVKLEETFDQLQSNTPIAIVEEEIEEAAVTTTAGQQLAYYPYPSDVNVADILSIKLTATGTNYKSWLNQIISLMVSQDLINFLISPVPSEVVINPDQDNEDNAAAQEVLNVDYQLWRKTDLLLKGWILFSLSKDLLNMVKDLDTSRDVLVKLEEAFVPENERFLYKTPIAIEEGGNDLKCYLPLYKAALVGDWETAERFLKENKGAETAIIAPQKQTVLHVAAGTGNTDFLEKLVKHLPKETMMLKMTAGRTAFSIAMLIGNTDAVKIMREKNPALLSTRDKEGNHPMVHSLSNGKTDTLKYLQSVSSDADYDGQAAVELFSLTIVAGFLDVALDLVKDYPHAASLESIKYMCPLMGIAGKASSFRSGMCFNFFESFIYSCVPLKRGSRSGMPTNGVDIENPANVSKILEHGGVPLIGGAFFGTVYRRWHMKLWDAIEFLVPLIKNIRQKKLEHHHAIQLVRCLCEGIRSSNDDSVCIRRTRGPILRAAALGVPEVIEEIVDILPCAVWSFNDNDGYILQIAVQNRCEKIFNLVHRMNKFEISSIMSHTDDSMNCILHLAGRLAPQHKLNLVSGAALQMQRELQWFKEVEKFVDPLYKEQRNSSGETPAMIFTREHKDLVIEGQKWMKDTANSCTIAASLIITIVFAAAITVPGGNNGDTGLPIFSNGSAFWLFAISDAISLFTSTTSLLMFLSILTARYAEQDFLIVLPKRLILGLLTLFLSITSMIIAFSTTVYLVFGEKTGWILIPLAALSCFPITSFVTLQFPLLRDVFSSTYGHGIFGKKIDRPLHQCI